MEQHPVPQNVTTFQFRLIGDMTIKQFGYLCGGAIVAFIFYKLPVPIVFSLPLAAMAGLLGFGLAFVPIEERPMDVWILSFFKNAYSPTQFVWQREATNQRSNEVTNKGASTSTSPVTAVQAKGIGNGTPHAPAPNPFAPQQPNAPVAPHQVIAAKHNPLDALASLFGSPSPHTQAAQRQQAKTTPAAPDLAGHHIPDLPPKVVSKEQAQAMRQHPTASPEENIAEATQKETALEQKVTTLQKELETKNTTDARVVELQKQLTEMIADRERMEKEIIAMKLHTQNQPSAASQRATAPPPVVAMPQRSSPPPPTQPTVKVMNQDVAMKAGLPRLTTYPNIVTGIIKDNQNSLLPGVLVTVQDKEGIPLRALKTNRLGQFAASTPLPNGTYMIVVEDPRTRYVFDRVQITLNGSIVPAIEVVARSQKELNREKLAKELFGNQI